MSSSPRSTAQREIVLFGASGQLGAALDHQFSRRPEWRIRRVRWAKVGDPALLDHPLDLRKAVFGEEAFEAIPRDVVLASGVLDPQRPVESLKYSNLEFPRRLMEFSRTWFDGKSPVRFISVGSIMENFPDVCAGNPYLASKLELSRWIASQPLGEGRTLHVRVHTLYGGQPKPHMFLGQMIRALRDGKAFEMTSGEQLREYQHVADLAFAFEALLGLDWREAHLGPLLEINSGKPVRLADLARAVFDACGHPELLKIGSLARPQGENLNRAFPPSPAWLLPAARDAIQGVVEAVRREVFA